LNVVAGERVEAELDRMMRQRAVERRQPTRRECSVQLLEAGVTSEGIYVLLRDRGV
jgi:hypothetical protein